ncbi:MAG TPA: TonB-dependent receptor [Lacunisphaera sp.]|nr:TonB-dependent receptor [Lacunisphaera sp.]
MSSMFRRHVLLSVLAPALAGFGASGDVVVLPAVSVSDQVPASTNQASVVPVLDNAVGAFADLARETPGFAVNDAGAQGFGTTTTLRGLGNTPYFSDASAPVYLDGIPLASGFTFPWALFDFAQVTLHRGPQTAAEFGRAGDAGVIEFTSAPTRAQPALRLSGTAGNYGLLAFAATAQSARTAAMDVSANVGTSQRDGYITNTQLHQPVDNQRSTYGRVQMHYRPAKDLELSVQALGVRRRDGAQPLVPLGGPFDAVSRGKEGVADADFTAASVGVTKHLPAGTLSATSSFTDWDLSPYANRLVVFGGFDFDSSLTQSQRAFNEEVRFAGERFSGGAFYSHARTEGSTNRTFAGFPYENSSFDLRSDTFALFGQAKFQPADGWTITPGARIERTEKDFTRTEIVPTSKVFDRSDAWDAFLPSVTATHRLGANTSAAFTIARGFKAGGYSAYTGQPALAGYDPQRTWGAEAAVTTSGPGSAWSATARAYAYDVRGYQIERSFAVPNTGTDEYLVVNARRARLLGLELETSWRPAPDVTVRFAAGLTGARLENFTDPFTGANYSGNQAPYVPKGNAALRVDYAPAHGLFAGVGATITGRTFYDEQETAMFSQESYALLDAHVGYAFAAGEVRVFARNLGDKAYYSAITPGVGHATPGAPFTWGVEASGRW